ncbi:MAG: hypothetical protein KKG93_07220 [Bacteroidetes bacterium]|nr:hypothetical protein [Bacteroidota bacterium]
MLPNKKSNTNHLNENEIRRVTALWAFSEAAFGGILHALRIPLTGIFIGSAAVMFITLLSYYSSDKKNILRATIVVVIVKALISPHTPLTAYFAVFLQGIMGYSLFSLFKSHKISAFILGLFSLLYSAFHRVIILTVVFGAALWQSLDEFAKFILLQLGIAESETVFSFSFLLIGLYVSLHLAAGIYIGIKAGKLDKWLESKRPQIEGSFTDNYYNAVFEKKNKGKRKYWWKRPSGIVLITFLLAALLISYFSPAFNENRTVEILIMIFRSVVILFLWFVVIAPLAAKLFKKIIEKKKFEKASEINFITNLFPRIQQVINYCWKSTTHLKGITRFKKFLSDSLAMLLILEINNNG